jgi:hypothetical protein
MEQKTPIENNRKCYNCGKEFRTPTEYQRHKNRKTPCLIREVAPEHVTNPNRCIFCNKIFSKHGNILRHLKTCKIKNGGMNILDEKVQHEQKIRVLEELREHDKKEIDQLKRQMADLQSKLVPCQTNNINMTNNNTINQNVTINFYNYDKPRTDILHLIPDDLMTHDINRKLMELIYFNKLLPENHVLYRPNLKEQRLLIYKNDSWKNVAGENLGSALIDIKNVLYLTGHDKINGGDLYKTDDDFFKLCPSIQKMIQNFNGGESITDGTIMEIITENRELVRGVIPDNL